MNLHHTVIAIGLLLSVEVLSKDPPPQYTFEDESTAQFDTSIEPQTSAVQFPFLPQQAYQESDADAGQLQANTPEPTPLPATATPQAKPATNTSGVLATYGQPSALPVSGYAMFYNPNVMQEVMQNRLAMGHVSVCGECVGSVALLRAGDLNRRVWLQWADGTVEGPFLVADVAATHHVDHLLARNWVVDVDHATAVRRRMAGPVLVTVWGSPPAGSAAPQSVPFEPLYSTMPTAWPTPLPAVLPTLMPVAPTATPLPALVAPAATATPLAPSVTVPQGFPPDTPVPMPTALPALSHSPAAHSPATPTPTATTLSPQGYAPNAPLAQPAEHVNHSDESPMPQWATQNRLPPDTPVPSPTALPAINPGAPPVSKP